MKKTKYITTRYDVNADFYVEVSPNGDVIEFVLCMKNYGIKSYMFGLCKKDCPKENWEKVIKNNIGNCIADIKCVDSTTAVNSIDFFAKHNAKVRQETAREILQKMKDNIMLADFGCGDGYEEVVDMDTKELKELANKYGIEWE